MLESLLAPYIPSRFIEDERYRNWYIRVINPLPGIRISGVHIPDLKKIAGNLIKEEKALHLIEEFERLQTLDSRSDLSFEEKMLWGMLVNGLPCSYEDRLERVIRFIPAIDNWYVCDIFCSDANWCETHEEQTWQFLQGYFHSLSEFEVRFAIVFSLFHFLDGEHIDQIFKRISGLNYDTIKSEYDFVKVSSTPSKGTVKGPIPYYVNMAVAWLMATALYKFPEKTRNFAHSGNIPDVVIKLYTRKAKESFRTRTSDPL